jgi:hypothetical protein
LLISKRTLRHCSKDKIKIKGVSMANFIVFLISVILVFGAHIFSVTAAIVQTNGTEVPATGMELNYTMVNAAIRASSNMTMTGSGIQADDNKHLSYGDCMQLTAATPRRLFVPGKTAAEWKKFVDWVGVRSVSIFSIASVMSCPSAPASCGNGTVQAANETCDNGPSNGINGNGDVPTALTCPYGTCNYCTVFCQSASVTYHSCGDTTIDAASGEVCDDGVARNGTLWCTPSWSFAGSTCNNCNATCTGTTPSPVGPHCGDLNCDVGFEDGTSCPGDCPMVWTPEHESGDDCYTDGKYRTTKWVCKQNGVAVDPTLCPGTDPNDGNTVGLEPCAKQKVIDGGLEDDGINGGKCVQIKCEATDTGDYLFPSVCKNLPDPALPVGADRFCRYDWWDDDFADSAACSTADELANPTKYVCCTALQLSDPSICGAGARHTYCVDKSAFESSGSYDPLAAQVDESFCISQAGPPRPSLGDPGQLCRFQYEEHTPLARYTAPGCSAYPALCGDSYCSAGESNLTCPADCP